MIYKDQEIMARVHKSMSDLFSLTDDGELDESQDILLDNEDDTIVWYEVSGSEHISTPFDSRRVPGFETIEDAKASIDWYEEEYKDEV